jgi:Fe-Mn family superoxide dismutase
MIKFEIPKLEYAYDSLEPHIDEKTMIIHHDKHHQAYADKFNAALEKHPELNFKSAEEVMKNIEKLPEDIRTAVKNNGGGFVNHSFFWKILKKDVPIQKEIKEEIEKQFSSFEKFKEDFTTAALGLFGSGWVWLVLENKKLKIVSTTNQNLPEGIPLLTIDVWEHAYYLKYQNKRAEYVENFFKVINWEKVNENFTNALNGK